MGRNELVNDVVLFVLVFSAELLEVVAASMFQTYTVCLIVIVLSIYRCIAPGILNVLTASPVMAHV